MLAAFDNLFAHAPVNPAAQVNMNVGGAIPKYIIGPILGKALGMTAARNINRGELVLSEPSIIELDIGPQSIYNPDVFFDPRKRHNGDSALSTRFNQLDPARQMLLTALHSRVRNRGTLGIVSTNAFERTKDVDGVEYCIIYVCDVISRVNHSCRPNAVVEWDATLGQATLFATMPITAGTEVTVDYISNVSTYLQRELDRRAELQKSYAFRCECAACGLPRRSNAVDDNLRLQTAVIRQQVQDIDPAQAVVDFSDRAQHRHRDLQILRTYTLNLEQLGARNGKLVEAYTMLSEFHQGNYHAANLNAVDDHCRHCEFPIHQGAHLNRAIEALEQAKTINIRCSGRNYPEVQRQRVKLQELKDLRDELPTSPKL